MAATLRGMLLLFFASPATASHVIPIDRTAPWNAGHFPYPGTRSCNSTSRLLCDPDETLQPEERERLEKQLVDLAEGSWRATVTVAGDVHDDDADDRPSFLQRLERSQPAAARESSALAQAVTWLFASSGAKSADAGSHHHHRHHHDGGHQALAVAAESVTDGGDDKQGSSTATVAVSKFQLKVLLADKTVGTPDAASAQLFADAALGEWGGLVDRVRLPNIFGDHAGYNGNAAQVDTDSGSGEDALAGAEQADASKAPSLTKLRSQRPADSAVLVVFPRSRLAALSSVSCERVCATVGGPLVLASIEGALWALDERIALDDVLDATAANATAGPLVGVSAAAAKDGPATAATASLAQNQAVAGAQRAVARASAVSDNFPLSEAASAAVAAAVRSTASFLASGRGGRQEFAGGGEQWGLTMVRSAGVGSQLIVTAVGIASVVGVLAMGYFLVHCGGLVATSKL